MNEKILFDRKTAAAALSISTRALDYLISAGKVRVRRFGRRILIPRDELERLGAKDQERLVPEEDAAR